MLFEGFSQAFQVAKLHYGKTYGNCISYANLRALITQLEWAKQSHAGMHDEVIRQFRRSQ